MHSASGSWLLLAGFGFAVDAQKDRPAKGGVVLALFTRLVVNRCLL
ncbi:hypothetical protein L248_0625 [Schleiferilactobacillus shenzhenensis LY-73]|uniref:Uncharacterized protein n=1 Tax=Schleiferilactobacillus shenzhenensis LY-73 TaxID=1231336 RepID=U4TIR0_9LACO|nr:hypothetical protein L248_0625 [Schleiferilactobacillus shenzhenensis LY-73]